MTETGGKVVVVTGASRGFGRAIALEVAERGHRLVATMRNPDGFRPEVAAEQEMDQERLDVTDTSSVTSALSSIEDRHGRIDVLINNAGYGLYGPIEGLTEEAVRLQLETNTVGMWRTCKAVLPGMRRRGEGLIINITSGGARLAIPLMGMYCASKAAVHMFSEALAYEVRGFGVKVAVVEPGAYRTDWQTTSLDVETGGTGSPYEKMVEKALAEFRSHAAQMPPPQELAEGVADLVESENPSFHNFIAPEGTEELTKWALSLSAEERDEELRGTNPFFPSL